MLVLNLSFRRGLIGMGLVEVSPLITIPMVSPLLSCSLTFYTPTLLYGRALKSGTSPYPSLVFSNRSINKKVKTKRKVHNAYLMNSTMNSKIEWSSTPGHVSPCSLLELKNLACFVPNCDHSTPMPGVFIHLS